jgi:hypothetical protein
MALPQLLMIAGGEFSSKYNHMNNAESGPMIKNSRLYSLPDLHPIEIVWLYLGTTSSLGLPYERDENVSLNIDHDRPIVRSVGNGKGCTWPTCNPVSYDITERNRAAVC